MPTPTDYRVRLRQARIDAGLNGRQLAALAGLSTTHISAVESGQRDLTAPLLFAWSRACKSSLDWIAGDPDPAPVPDPGLVTLDLEPQLQEAS